MFKKFALKFFANQPVEGQYEDIDEEPTNQLTVFEYFTTGTKFCNFSINEDYP